MSAKVEDLFADLIKATGEPLHSDLLPYLEDGVLGKQLRHPLVYQVPLWANGHANAYYLQKKKAVAEALENKNYNSYVYLHERPYRLQAFSEIANELYKEVTTALIHPGYREEDLYLVLNRKLQSLEDEQVRELTKMIKDWETEVPDETTLYTLGLRRAIDLIQGNLPL
jgi:hypothetical protein